MARALRGGGGQLSPGRIARLLGALLVAALLAPPAAADDDVRWAIYPRAVFGGGGLGVSVTHRPSRVHFDFVGDVRGVLLGAPRVGIQPPDVRLSPFARLRPRFAVGFADGSFEVFADVGLLARPREDRPIELDPAAGLVPWVRGIAELGGSPIKGLRLSVQGGVEHLGAFEQAESVSRVGGRARATYAGWFGEGLPLPKKDFVLADPEGPPPVVPNVAPLMLLFADTNPPGGVYLDAWADAGAGWIGAESWADTFAAVVPRFRAEVVASIPLPLPIPMPAPPMGSLEFQGVAGVVPVSAPGIALLPYPGALTRDGRLFRGNLLLKTRVALRFPIGPPPPPAPGFLIFGLPTLQLDLGLGDTWTGGTLPAPGERTGDTAEMAGEVGLEFRLPMAFFGVGWTLWVRGEVGLRSGEVGATQAAFDPQVTVPWIGERGTRAPLGFAVGLGVPIR